VAGDKAKPAPPGAASLIAGVPKRLVSGSLAGGEDECIPYRPLKLAVVMLGLVCVPGRGSRGGHGHALLSGRAFGGQPSV
jgi:hypothetical protein